MVQIRKYCEKFRLTVSSPLFLCVVKYLDTNKISTASTNSLTYHLLPYLSTFKQTKNNFSLSYILTTFNFHITPFI